MEASSKTTAKPAKPPQSAKWVPIVIGLGAALWFGWGIDGEPQFADEAAYVSQSYFFDFYVSGDWDDWAWLEYHAYDLPPLPKYFIGGALSTIGESGSGRIAAGKWFRDTEGIRIKADVLLAARVPSVIFGVIGCLAIYRIGRLWRGPWVGSIAAILLTCNPLYRLHARRAMSDVPSEALILLALAIGISAWEHLIRGRLDVIRCVGWGAICGAVAGLAVLAKLNGGVAVMTMAAWLILGNVLPGVSMRRVARSLVFAASGAGVALLTFLVGNPYLTAHPDGPCPPGYMAPVPADEGIGPRLWRVIDHRRRVSEIAWDQFPDDALRDPASRLAVVAAQGFGRYGSLGPRPYNWKVPHPRYSWRLDGGALVWLPLVLVGFVQALMKGWSRLRAGFPPTSWALAAYWLVATGTVAWFLPLAWDRYELPIQAPSALLAAGALASVGGLVGAEKRFAQSHQGAKKEDKTREN